MLLLFALDDVEVVIMLCALFRNVIEVVPILWPRLVFNWVYYFGVLSCCILWGCCVVVKSWRVFVFLPVFWFYLYLDLLSNYTIYYILMRWFGVDVLTKPIIFVRFSYSYMLWYFCFVVETFSAYLGFVVLLKICSVTESLRFL